MRIRRCAFFVFLIFTPAASFAQSPLVSKWEKVGPVNFTALVHQSPTRIVATTDHGYLYITDDDGTTWQRQEVSDTVDINGIAFGDSLHGVLIASGNLMLTSDGGATWHAQSSPMPGLVLVGQIGADTILVGTSVMVGTHTVVSGTDTFLTPTMNGKIYRSTNAGVSWDTVFTDTAGGYWSSPMKLDFFFGHGFAIGSGFYVKTTDAGAHWTRHSLQGNLQDIDFYNSDTGAIASDAGYYVTTDGGANWAFTPVFHDERDDDYTTVKFFGPNNYFMFGTPNAYYFTSNDLGATVS